MVAVDYFNGTGMYTHLIHEDINVEQNGSVIARINIASLPLRIRQITLHLYRRLLRRTIY